MGYWVSFQLQQKEKSRNEILQMVPWCLSLFQRHQIPTSGFLLFFPKADIVELDMSIEDAAKLVISAGLVYPPTKKHLQKLPLKKAEPTKKFNIH